MSEDDWSELETSTRRFAADAVEALGHVVTAAESGATDGEALEEWVALLGQLVHSVSLLAAIGDRSDVEPLARQLRTVTGQLQSLVGGSDEPLLDVRVQLTEVSADLLAWGGMSRKA